MYDAFIRVAAATPKIKVADTAHNTEKICELIKEAAAKDVSVLVFPELTVTGASCGDLFFQDALIKASERALAEIVRFSTRYDVLVVVGLPWQQDSRIYNVAAFVSAGRLLGLVPKRKLDNRGVAAEGRYFSKGDKLCRFVEFISADNQIHLIPFGANQIFNCENLPQVVVAAEIGSENTVPVSPAVAHAMAGATLIVNPSAAVALAGKAQARKAVVTDNSARLICGYITANAGEGESTQDVVYSAHNIIAENGRVLAEQNDLQAGMIIADIDMGRIMNDRRRKGFFGGEGLDDYLPGNFEIAFKELELCRKVDATPFIPADAEELKARCEEILNIQTMGLKKRIEHTNAKNVTIGISGGLDSTLALIVTVRAFEALGLDKKNITAATMPCFGTTDRTYNNACKMVEELGASLVEVNIMKAVEQHFADIGHDMNQHDTTYENAQARERTQVLMDLANKAGGFVIGTGDMSELALGWATYNGDHMSMYGVNASVPKTLVRHLVRYYADTCGNESLAAVLYDVLDTPVSPELLPPTDGEIAQKTEELVGPYELHDFYLYYALRYGFDPKKIQRLAEVAFAGVYDAETIEKWRVTFFRRFFSQQFKRSCLPDGPKVGTVGVSPRGDLRMPSDACGTLWK